MVYDWRRKFSALVPLFEGLIITAAIVTFCAVPMYRRWIIANFFKYIMTRGDRAAHLMVEATLCCALWTYFLRRGVGCARLYAFFTALELGPAMLDRAASGPWEFACLCLFPTFWTLIACGLSGVARGAARLLKALLAALLAAGIAQYVIYLCYTLKYGRRPGPNTLMTLMGTNLVEARSFVTDQFGVLPTIAGLCLLVAFVLWMKLMISRCPMCPLGLTLTLAALALAGAFFSYSQATAYTSLLFDFEKGYRQYQTALNSLERARSEPSRDISKLGITKEGRGEVCVIVIGESASRRHMARWGYRRPTTPWLCDDNASVQNSLVVLKKAYSCMTHTEPAVTMALSQFSNYDPALLFRDGSRDSTFIYTQMMRSFSLFEIFSGAGIRTYWFSNQEKIGAYNNLISALSQTADEQEFLEDLPPSDRVNGHQDGELLPMLARTLARADPNENLVVFLHLRGSHWSYKNSAPVGWPWLPSVYRQKNETPEMNARIDAYDRSITYTDSVLRWLRGLLQESKFSVASMIYFSDHGEDVTGIGHNFDGFRPVMAEIPVVTWFSRGYRQRWPETVRQLRANSGRIFTNDLIFDLALGVNHVSFTGAVPERQITSPRYAVTAQNARFWGGRLLKTAIPDLED